MPSVLSTIRAWLDWISTETRSLSRENLSWHNGWKASFWFLVNRNSLVMSDPLFKNLRETEALWDPDDPLK